MFQNLHQSYLLWFEQQEKKRTQVILDVLKENEKGKVHTEYKNNNSNIYLPKTWLEKAPYIIREKGRRSNVLIELFQSQSAHAGRNYSVYTTGQEGPTTGRFTDNNNHQNNNNNNVEKTVQNVLLLSGDTAAVWERILYRARQENNHNEIEKQKTLEKVLQTLQATYTQVGVHEIHLLYHFTVAFQHITTTAHEIYFYVSNLFSILKNGNNILQDAVALQHHCGVFLSLFHHVNKTLYIHFLCEGLSPLEWVPDLLSYLLADRMPVHNLLLVWDYYFAEEIGSILSNHNKKENNNNNTVTHQKRKEDENSTDNHSFQNNNHHHNPHSVFPGSNFALHPFVCLAVLTELTEELIESDKEMILHRLRQLPSVEVEGLLQKAIAIRESLITDGYL
ncbi:Rab-GTPase-TBC domain containing protein, putative [Angomonas deanei]|uniref:Rab-GTPase-TBC domain containing protein, putative n=1 Tax=Angomonas deanei TaxID=59799 RepID=A0A7G2CLG2_9TRYP|nr:Rab-GTPase-TBC domain containing protein, putative [Angomonas deanei]